MAIQIVLGDPLRTFLTYQNPDKSPVSGVVFTRDNVVLAERADGSDFGDVLSFTEVRAGVYRIEGTTAWSDPAGEWTLIVQGPDGTQWEETWDVLATPPRVAIVQPVPGVGASRAELRRLIADKAGDLVLVTADAMGTESSVVSQRDLAREHNAFKGMQVYAAAGTAANVGMTATVSASDYEARAITFFPELRAPTQAGDVFELYNRRGTGWRLEDYNRAINAAILQAGEEHATEPVTETLAGAFSQVQPYVLIPAGWVKFSGVEIVGRDGSRTAVPPTGWQVDRFSRELELRGSWRSRAHGRFLRIKGHRRPGTLEADDARTSIAAEWLVHEALATLYQQHTSNALAQSERSRLFFLERQGADGRRPSVVTSYAPNTVDLS